MAHNDMVKATRCKDCMFYEPQGWRCGWCHAHTDGSVMFDNDYCSRARRWEDYKERVDPADYPWIKK